MVGSIEKAPVDKDRSCRTNYEMLVRLVNYEAKPTKGDHARSGLGLVTNLGPETWSIGKLTNVGLGLGRRHRENLRLDLNTWL